ncbi:hypothetical protein CT19425_U610007 [Cupriavidus taiwanensis]|uniref:Integrase catalytic domain-containing protein n=1 Tax=Cupriavidus taiwanensis TaxID=164546 RepID=A0A375I9Q2_9BURK|nr:hypothetical protein CT19425_U610007 [Cupriavidus taiwanensis]
MRFETAPGKQMQADFTVIRRGREPLLVLVATLGYSRASFVRFTAGEDTATLCACLEEALAFFGGVPEHILFDNAKSVVRRARRARRWPPSLEPGTVGAGRAVWLRTEGMPSLSRQDQGQGRALQSLSQGELCRAAGRHAQTSRAEAGCRGRQPVHWPLADGGGQHTGSCHHWRAPRGAPCRRARGLAAATAGGQTAACTQAHAPHPAREPAASAGRV